jgi:glutamate dehydrogenase
MARERAQAAVQTPSPDQDFDAFRQRLFAHWDEGDRSDVSLAVLEQLARGFWRFGAERRPGENKLRIYTGDEGGAGGPIGVLEIVTDDRPFLVASVLAELGDFDLSPIWISHPVVEVERDEMGARRRLVDTRDEAGAPDETHQGIVRESMVQIAFERPIDLAESGAIEHRVRRVLEDVAHVVDDWRAMMDRLDASVAELGARAAAQGGQMGEEFDEAKAFLGWLKDNHFIFMGVRDYDRMHSENGVELERVAHSDLGILRDPKVRVLRRQGAGQEALTPAVAAFLDSPSPIVITKSNFRSNIHRRVYMDYIGIKRYSPEGEVIGERRFLGLFTASAYNRLPENIPLLRRKIALVERRAAFPPESHNANTLANILETYPRDELFQIDVDELYETTTGMMRLYERPRTRLFIRHDKFDRFVSALVFVPRERYSSDLRERIGGILKDAFDGRVSAFYPLLGDSPLVRVHFIIGRNAGPMPQVDIQALESRIVAAARTWRDGLHDVLVLTRGEEMAHRLLPRYGEAFSLAYRETFSPELALADIDEIEGLRDFPDVAILVYRLPEDEETSLRIKLYRRGEPISLSRSMPILEHMGLSVINEFSYEVGARGASLAREQVHLHDFCLVDPKGEALDFHGVKDLIESAFPAIWRGDAEDDGFNRLIVEAGLPWREVVILRALARYLVQTGTSLSHLYMEETLAGNPEIVRLILSLFETKFDPDKPGTAEERQGDIEEIEADITKCLEEVQSLDEDRILRRFLNLVDAMVRTNYYQQTEGGAPRASVAFKFNSKSVLGLPEPVPQVEVFVYSPRVEAVHLRFGPVARGGIRWSDRREDFRTEILGLVKAQYVKNAVIVPVGAKGGFVPKRLPTNGTREEIQAEAIECYKLFMETLLDLTDNLQTHRPDAPPIRPDRTVCQDAPDPYLVVAADKGTASFSDIANGIALEKNFWLGDAFASGGSNGYDHKAMGITARGAWEAVKRHFREMGTDIQSEPFSVVGVGDMSGDVFGNGMLLSRQTKLVAAFDHRDIFIDPSPDAETSYKERERLFELPRSSWQDYDKSLISKGGGVFSRKQKTIPLTDEIRAVLDIEDQALSPPDLIRAVLKAPADLLWFGGIGTYVKAKSEHNNEVGDPANDAYRIDGGEVRAKVIGEGANLGCTQLGRIAFARAGGRINTDAIDNSAGVDTSDHEVNIKILLDAAVAQKALGVEERHTLLKSMAEDVASHVLVHNYDQTLALTLAESTSREDIDAHARVIRSLEREGRLKRDVERLPLEEEISELKAQQRGLTRPEIAVLLAYSKIKLFDELTGSPVPDEPALEIDLEGYFPPVLGERFDEQLMKHRLRREIIATILSNEMVNVGGLTFASRMHELVEADTAQIARAYAIVRDVFGVRGLRDRINALDGKIESSLQSELHVALRTFLRRQTIWFLRRGSPTLVGIAETVEHYRRPVEELRASLEEVSSAYAKAKMVEACSQYTERGVPEELATDLSRLDPMLSAGDLVDVAHKCGAPIKAAARAHAALGEALGLEQIVEGALHLTSDDHWERMVIRRTSEDLIQAQAALAGAALRAVGGKGDGSEAASALIAAHAADVARIAASFDELTSGGGLSAARLALAVGHMRDLAVFAKN